MYLREVIEKSLSLLNEDAVNTSKPLSSYFSYERSVGGINCPDRNVVTFQGLGKGIDGEVTASMRGIEQERDIIIRKVFSTENELASLIYEWKNAVYWWQSRISFHRLEIGRKYQIVRSFTDLDGRSYKNGTNFSLLAKDVFAKEEGYTIKTSAGIIRLQGQRNIEILENLDLFISEA